MLPDRQYQLLTAYVDGELDPRQRLLAERLVEDSAEARAFLEKLASDSRELRDSPRHKAPETLPEVVMETLTEGIGRPVLPTVAAGSKASAIPVWAGLAVAACVLVAVGIGTYFMVGGLLVRSEPEMASQPIAPASENKRPEPAPPKLDPLVADLLGGAAKKFADPVPSKDSGIRLVLAELHEGPVQKRLANEFQQKSSMWLDVPVVDAAKGIERVTDAFQMSGIKVLTTTKAGNKKDAKAADGKRYLLYVENLRPEELTQILDQLATGRTVEQVVLKGMNKEDHKYLADAMHVSWKDVTPYKLGGNMVDLPTLVEGEQKQKGSITKNGKGLERLAILLPLAGGGNPALSPEVQQFLNARQAQNQGALQVVLIIHDKKAA